MPDTVTVAAPDGAVAQVDGVTGHRYKARAGGLYDMHPADAKALLADGGFRPSLGSPTRGGYACRCGFRPVVRDCSRCGHHITDEEIHS
jgi:hypothetical protein